MTRTKIHGLDEIGNRVINDSITVQTHTRKDEDKYLPLSLRSRTSWKTLEISETSIKVPAPAKELKTIEAAENPVVEDSDPAETFSSRSEAPASSSDALVEAAVEVASAKGTD